MKRLSYIFGGIAILLLFVTVGCASRVEDMPETAVTTDEVEVNATAIPRAVEFDDKTNGEETAVLPEREELPLLPQFEGTQAQGLGGGERVFAENDSLAAAVVSNLSSGSGLYYGDVFSGTTFILNDTLPADIVRAVVQQQMPTPISVEEASQLAATFGFSDGLYKNPAFTYVDEAGIEHVENIPATYYAFDGTRTLNIDPFGIYYDDGAFSYEYVQQSGFDQIAPKAEAFLQERGLLTFEYSMERIWGNDIGFYRQINGRSLDQPEISVSLNENGDIVSVSMQMLNHLETLGNYPLRSAEEAWQLILDGVTKNNIRYNYKPVNVDIEQPIVIDDFEDSYRYWSRTYQSGDEVHIYIWPSIYVAADEVAAPRIEAYPFILQADDETLRAIADDPTNQFHFWGEAGENGRLLQLAGWEILPPDQEPVFLQGNVQYEGDQALFIADSGKTYLLPDAPTDLPSDVLLDLFGWNIRDTDDAYPIVDWESINMFINDELEPTDIVIEEPSIIGEPGIYEPIVYQQATIDEVTLIYSFTYLFPEFEENAVRLLDYQPPTIVIQPVWQFSGTADNGDQIDLFVEAVAPEYFQ